MKILLIICYFSLFSFLFSLNPPTVFKVNLDLAPEERFKDLILEKKQDLQALQAVLQSEFKIPSFVYKIVEYYADYLYWNKEFVAELRGVAKYSELPFGEIFFVNFMYEIFASCTSLITQDENGNILHGRNLDYDFRQQLANLTTRFEYYRNDKFLFSGDGTAGYLGLVTGLKPNGFTISINERDSSNYLYTIYQVLFRKTPPIPYFIRQVLERAENFNVAVEMFKNEEFAAPCYLIISGMEKNEGLVITRDRRNVYNVSQINVDSDNQWFIVQTNYDRDIPDPASDYRRVPAENRLKLIGRHNINKEILYDRVLTQKPNLRDSTITTAILSAQTGYYNTTIWF